MPEADIEGMILQLAEPLARSLGLVVWGVECLREGRFVLRIYVDIPDAGEGSPSIDMCETLSRRIGPALEVEDAIPGAYVLEVSTPGLNRRFFHPGQCSSYVGDIVDITLRSPVQDANDAGRRRWRGTLAAVEGTDIVLRPAKVTEEGEVLEENRAPVRLPWKNISRASRFHVFTRPSKPGKGKRFDAPGKIQPGANPQSPRPQGRNTPPHAAERHQDELRTEPVRNEHRTL